jgi:hypothetical protein
VEASGITRRWAMCCNVSQLEADPQIAGHWLPSRNDPALNREAGNEPMGGYPRRRKRDSDVGGMEGSFDRGLNGDLGALPNVRYWG